MRIVKSPIFGNMSFSKQSSGLYSADSGKVHLLGNGEAGGKGAGVSYLDVMQHYFTIYQTSRAIGLCEDYFRLPEQPIDGPRFVAPSQMRDDCLDLLFKVMESLNFADEIVIRSSSQIEDQIGMTCAGKFKSEVHCLGVDSDQGKLGFINKLLEVLNSAYSNKAVRAYKRAGYTKIPPMPVVIHEAKGQEWEHVEQAFFPLYSFTANTSSVNFIRFAYAFGFGRAVANGLTQTDYYNRILELQKTEGRKNRSINENEYLYFINYENNKLERREFFHYIRSVDAINDFFQKRCGNVENRGNILSRTTAPLALRFEQELGLPVELEGACCFYEQSSPTFLQIRPVRKTGILEKPKIDQKQILAQTDKVLGEASRPFSRIVIATDDDFAFELLLKDLEKMGKKYPGSLLVLDACVTKSFKDYLRILLEYYDGVIVSDRSKKHNFGSGDGLSHFALNIMDEEKLVLYFKYGSLTDIISYFIDGDLLEDINISKRHIELSVQVIKLEKEFTLSGNQEDQWGMIYKS